MKVTSTKSISFPKLGWAISAGETKDMPSDKEAQDRILQESAITASGGGKKESIKKVEEEIKNESDEDIKEEK